MSEEQKIAEANKVINEYLDDVETALGVPYQPSPVEWVPLAKALFDLEHNPKFPDQSWFDFQGKAQLLLTKARRYRAEPTRFDHISSKPEVVDGCNCAICRFHRSK